MQRWYLVAELPTAEELEAIRVGLEAGDPSAPEAAADLAEHISAEGVEAMSTLGAAAAEWGRKHGAVLSPSSSRKVDTGAAAEKTPRKRSTAAELEATRIRRQYQADTRDEAVKRGLAVKSKGSFMRTEAIEKAIQDDIALKGSGIHGRGVASVEAKIKLGRYTLNARKLAEGVVQLRSAKGGAVHKFPSQTVSDAVASALRKIVSGGALSFDDISGLDESERRYLHDVATHSGISTNLPQPKDARAAQSDRFTVLRGELVAGNDSQELVREFKGLLLSMANNGQLPRAQAYAAMTDLLALGK